MKKHIQNLIFNLFHNKFIYWFESPRSIWKDATKVVIKPKIKFYYGDKSPIFYKVNSFIVVSGLNWKTKFKDYRFEDYPYVKIGKLYWVWEQPIDDAESYYEFILNYLYKYNKDIQMTYDDLKRYETYDFENNRWIQKYDNPPSFMKTKVAHTLS